MWSQLVVAGAVVVTGAIVVAGLAVYCARHSRRVRLRLARQLLHRRREWLEAEFLSLASAINQSRNLAWTDCQFDDAVALARDRQSGQLRALVGITITLAASEEDVSDEREAEWSQHAATAVFYFDGTQWTTDGRAVFNLSPTETIEHYSHELELVE